MSLEIATGFAGALGTSVQSDFAVRQVWGKVLRVHPKRALLMALLSKTMKGGKATAKKVEFSTQGEFVPSFTLTAAYPLGTETTFAIESNLALTDDTVAMCIGTGEQVIVRTRTSATSLTDILRGTGNVDAAPLVIGDKFVICQTAREEGVEDALSAIGSSPTLWHNWIQECEIDEAHTTLQKMQAQYNGDAISNNEMDVAFEFMCRTSRALHFQQKHVIAAGATGGGTYGQRVFGGALNYIQEFNENILTGVGNFTYSTLGDFMRPMSKFSSTGHFYGFGSAEIFNIVSNWQLPYARLKMGEDKEFGFEITRVYGGGWSLDLVTDWAFEDDGLQDRLHIYDVSQMRLLTGSGLDESYNPEIKSPKKNGAHLIQNQRTAAYTMVCNPYAMGYISGITG